MSLKQRYAPITAICGISVLLFSACASPSPNDSPGENTHSQAEQSSTPDFVSQDELRVLEEEGYIGLERAYKGIHADELDEQGYMLTERTGEGTESGTMSYKALKEEEPYIITFHDSNGSEHPYTIEPAE